MLRTIFLPFSRKLRPLSEQWRDFWRTPDPLLLHEGGSGELGASANITMYIDVDQSSDWSSGDIGLKSDGTTYEHPTALDYDVIDNYDSESWDATENMTALESHYFFVLWDVSTSIGNDIQGDSASFDITFVLEQGAAD